MYLMTNNVEALEYLLVFSDEGPYTVSVKLHPGQMVRSFHCEAAELFKLVSKETGEFVTALRVDDYLFNVSKIVVDPEHFRIQITVNNKWFI